MNSCIEKILLGELDFVIEMSGKVVPIEVKSGKAYKAHKALNNFKSVPDYHIEKAYVFSVGNVETEGSPLFLTATGKTDKSVNSCKYTLIKIVNPCNYT